MKYIFRTMIILILPNLPLSAQIDVKYQYFNVNPDTKAEIPGTAAGKLLKDWLTAHNSGDNDTFRDFIKSRYSETLLRRVNFDKHLNFYVEAFKEFGAFKTAPFSIEENSSHRIVAHFLKTTVKDENDVTPENIIIVEVDADPENPAYLQRGVGMGPLICLIRENARNTKSERKLP